MINRLINLLQRRFLTKSTKHDLNCRSTCHTGRLHCCVETQAAAAAAAAAAACSGNSDDASDSLFINRSQHSLTHRALSLLTCGTYRRKDQVSSITPLLQI